MQNSALRPLLVGKTTPRIYTPPLAKGPPGPCGCGCALTPETSQGFAVVEFSRDVLGIEPLPWQRWLLIHALELLPDGRYRFRTVLVLVARQNGKTTIVEIKNLFKLFVLRVPLVIGTAQSLDISEESWEKGLEIIESIPDLASELAHIDRANGKKTLKLVSGSRWKVAAASRKGGRGLSGDDVNLDELREHQTWGAWSAVSKTTMARRRAQVWAFSNAGDSKSVVLLSLQAKGRAAAVDPAASGDLAGSLGHFEWSAPDDCPMDDRDAWAQANPALGYGELTEEALASALETDPEEVFRTECLCQQVPDLDPDVIPAAVWRDLADPDSALASGFAFALDMPWDRSGVYIAAGGLRDDGKRHGELIETRPGTAWALPYLRERMQRWQPAAVLLDGAGPVASMADDVETLCRDLGVRFVKVTGVEMCQACGSFYDAATEDMMRHRGDPRISEALRGAKRSDRGELWRWVRKNSRADIAALVAMTLAIHGGVTYAGLEPFALFD